jgi:ribosomal protein S12 methylthiotransferase accessory factor
LRALRDHFIVASATIVPDIAGASALRTALAQPHGGFVFKLQSVWTDSDEPQFVLISGAARTHESFGSKCIYRSSSRCGVTVQGAGVGLSLDDALVPALAETLERCAAATFYDDQFIWASGDSLDHQALDLDTVARCSEAERAGEYCSLNLPTKNKPIRWVMAISLHDGEPILVPAVMVYSHAGCRGPQEQFWLPISTGCAANRTYEMAVLGGLCEVVERDAISLVWLQQLALPRILVDDITPDLSPFWERYLRASADIEYHFFDATTDIGLPTVYGVQVSRHHPYARTIVACATALTFDCAIVKVIKDFVAFKRSFCAERTLPDNTLAFKGLVDGASYMARPENANAFDFLLNSEKVVSLRALASKPHVLRTLAEVLRHLSNLNMQAIAIDLTTDEAIRAGLRVVRVLIPELQPLSVQRATQYRAHSRLYDAPSRIGYVAKTEHDLNHWPQPFA